jgi:hypothetical protein
MKLQPLKPLLLDELRMLRVVTSPLERFATNRAAFLATLAHYPHLQSHTTRTATRQV